MQKAIEVIRLVSSETDRVILFHSASGKDSIALLNLMAPYFREIVCIYMYLVKDLAHINRYLNYAIAKYNTSKTGQAYPCQMRYQASETGYSHLYPALVSGAPTLDEKANPLKQNN